MRRVAILAGVVVLAGLTGCGGSSGANKRPQLIVSAASSLRTAFSDYADSFRPAVVRLSFGGSDELATQIRAGGRADVFAAANTKLPAALFKEGKVERPVDFTANRLVLAVPSDSNVKSLDGIAKPGIKLAIGSASVPVGAYTRQVLAALPSVERNRILANVKTAEPDVAGIIGKLTQGAVNAGFVYATDVTATHGQLRALQLPARLEPTVVYAAAVIKGTSHHEQAKAFIDGLVGGKGQAALRSAGFLPVP
jgi:molybdate transport system substrate-binding protein